MNHQEYQQYLLSPKWQSIADAVKKGADYRCRLCNSPRSLQVHHRTYAHLGNEENHMEDLTCLCDTCHGGYHNLIACGGYKRSGKLLSKKERRKHAKRRKKWRAGAGHSSTWTSSEHYNSKTIGIGMARAAKLGSVTTQIHYPPFPTPG